ncbi:hypothetical protein H8S33_18705 [Ornithinibacillus sp. BX22]|uniref:Uncharacterized protein n=1 Tax=Ornithinibacillus hominis TaxID=2763055 RepID=A0A923L932_9BACI|nr:hypothetical protein [Ornithinibacillus hominis]MBC5638805.1 hypothetical protein [Ornithinibacillus hominis]
MRYIESVLIPMGETDKIRFDDEEYNLNYHMLRISLSKLLVVNFIIRNLISFTFIHE